VVVNMNPERSVCCEGLGECFCKADFNLCLNNGEIDSSLRYG